MESPQQHISYKELDTSYGQRLGELFPNPNHFIEVLPGNCIVPRTYENILDSIRDLPVYSDDIWMISYPRTGSTWAQEMIWLLGNKLDFEGAKKMQPTRAPILELTALMNYDHIDFVNNLIGNTVDVVRNLPRPRFIRTHLPWNLLPKEIETVNPKIVYIARNPKDLAISFYYYCKGFHALDGPLEDFLDLFLAGQLPMGCYWKHVLPYWKRSTEPNVLFLKYEDMSRDLPSVVRKTAKFLQLDYELTPDKLTAVCDHLQFEQMQKNPATNLQPLIDFTKENNSDFKIKNELKFIRNGKIGDWKNYFSHEMSERFDEWIERNTKGSGLKFEYE